MSLVSHIKKAEKHLSDVTGRAKALLEKQENKNEVDKIFLQILESGEVIPTRVLELEDKTDVMHICLLDYLATLWLGE